MAKLEPYRCFSFVPGFIGTFVNSLIQDHARDVWTLPNIIRFGSKVTSLTLFGIESGFSLICFSAINQTSPVKLTLALTPIAAAVGTALITRNSEGGFRWNLLMGIQAAALVSTSGLVAFCARNERVVGKSLSDRMHLFEVFFRRLSWIQFTNIILWTWSPVGFKQIFTQFFSKKRLLKKYGDAKKNEDFVLLDESFFMRLEKENLLQCKYSDEEEEMFKDSSAWMVNPSFQLIHKKDMDVSLDKTILHRLRQVDPFSSMSYSSDSIVVIEDPGYNTIFAYGISGTECERWIKEMELQGGVRCGSGMPREIMEILWQARIICPFGWWENRKRMWEDLRNIHKSAKELGYTYFQELLPPLIVESLGRRCRQRLEERQKHQCKSGESGYWFEWSDPAMVMLNNNFISAISRITEELVDAVEPLTLYYAEESWLDFHLDYHPFAFALSITVDVQGTNYEPNIIVIPKSEITTSYLQIKTKPGGAAFFYGEELAHYRHKIPKNCSLVSLSLSFDRI